MRGPRVPTGATRIRRAVVMAVAGLVLGSLPARAQAPDIEALAELRGIQLPAGHYELLQQQPDLYEFERALFNRVVPGRTAAAGDVRLPVILVLFEDSPASPHVSREEVQRALFDGPAPRGTITEAYLEMSLGALNVGGDVYGWARSTLPLDSVVGSQNSLGPDNRVGEYFLDALEQLDPDIDFTLYDNDGPDGVANSGDDDGFVDIVTFEYLEVAASCGGPAIWPHRSRMSSRTGAPYVTDDIGLNGQPIQVQDYLTQSATDCTGQNVQDAAVITHEFGHALGLPDWYHWVDPSIGPYGRRWVLGCWALMAAGSWGCGPVTDERPPYGPAHMVGYSKDYLGWLELVDPGEVWNQLVELPAIQTSGQALRIPLDDVGQEFLIAEFRDLIGFDHQLPGAGVLLYKQDDNGQLRPDPDSDQPYFLTMLEQDGNGSLVRMADEGGSRGEVGDAWGVGGVTGALNATTTPALRMSDGTWSRVQIHEVTVEGDRARLVISTGRTPRLVAPAARAEVMQVRTFYEGVRIAGGVGPYEGVGALPPEFWFEGRGDRMLVAGSLTDDAPRTVTFAVRDSGGNVSNEVSLEVAATSPWLVSLGTLLQPFLESDEAPPTPGELTHLDDTGNGNGRYDVGDLRRWMRDNR
jgi:M6 family metalloprotease-like protein